MWLWSAKPASAAARASGTPSSIAVRACASVPTIPMPGDYKCKDVDPNGCWVTIDYNFAGAVTDTTSWNAYLIGDPVRLVK